MTTSSILPSTGLPPPGLDRPVIPARFRPDIAGTAEKPSAPSPAPEYHPPPARPARAGEGVSDTVSGSVSGSVSGAGRSLGGTAAIAVQVSESAAAEKAQASATATPLNETQLSDDDQTEVARLRARDREVRAHESAHRTAGQGYTGSEHYDYVRGPDDRRYAVGGHVQIDTKAVPDDPRATIAKMEVVIRAALAPAQPSGQDRAVASAAAAQIREAEAELAAERQDSQKAAQGGDTQTVQNTQAAQTAQAAGTGPDATGQQPGPTARQPINIFA